MRKVITKLVYGDMVNTVIGDRNIIGVYIGVRGGDCYFLCPNGEVVIAKNEDINDLHVVSDDAFEEFEEISSKFFGELLRMDIIGRSAGVRDPNKIELSTAKERITLLGKHIKLKLVKNNVVFESGIKMSMDSNGYIHIILIGGKFNYEYIEEVWDNIEIDTVVKSTVPYAVHKEALDKIKKLEADIKVYKEALRHALRD